MDNKYEARESLVMVPRKPQAKAPQSLPAEFIRKIAELFNQQFADRRGQAEFLVYGGLFPDEALLCICLTQLNRPAAVSFYASCDLKKNVAEKPEQVTETLKKMVDLCASWFAQAYTESKANGLDAPLEAMAEMDRGWQSTKWEKQELFVKLTRENQLLESAADRFLRDADSH